MKKPITESQLQIQCVGWLKLQYKNLLFFHTPNTAKRSFALANWYKQMGVLSGVPDLFICCKKGGYGGLFIELKSKTGKPTDQQEKVMDKLKTEGYAVYLINSFDTFKKVVSDYLSGHIIIGEELA